MLHEWHVECLAIRRVVPTPSAVMSVVMSAVMSVAWFPRRAPSRVPGRAVLAGYV